MSAWPGVERVPSCLIVCLRGGAVIGSLMLEARVWDGRVGDRWVP